MKPCMKYAKFQGLWGGFLIIAQHSGHTSHLKEFTQIRRQLSHSHALKRIHCFLTEFATRLFLVTGRPNVQRTCAAHIAVKAGVNLYFTLFLLPDYSLFASTSVFHSFPCLLLSQSSVSMAHLRRPFQEMMKFKPPVCTFLMSRFREKEHQGKGLKHLSVWVGVWCCCNPSPRAAAGDKMFVLQTVLMCCL